MEIRLAVLNDIEQICELYHEFWEYNADLQPQYYKSATETGGYPRSVIENTDADLFVAVENEFMVGLIHVRELQTPQYDVFVHHKYAEVVDLIVTASNRRKGIGSALMDAAKNWSRARDLDYVELFVLAEASGEIQFYERENFKTVSHTMRYTL